MKTQYRTLIVVPALLVLFLTLNLESSTVFAQGTAFTYQGQLDNAGVPANGLYDMAFRLYTTSSGGNPMAGPVTNSAVGVTNGLFTTAVNLGNAFSGGSNWLELAVSTNGANAFTTLTPRQQLTPVPYAIAAENVNGTIGSQVSFSNAANQFTGTFTGTGGNLTGLNASQLTTGTVPATALNNAWKTTGNSGTGPSTNFVGTLDNQPLELRVNNQRGLRLEPAGSNSVNVIGGWIGNGVGPGAVGATVSGGGAGNYFGLIWSNQVASDFGTVAGGTVNSIQWGARYANIGGGWNNMIQSNAYSSAVGGGENNTIQAGAYESTIGGGFLNVIEGGQVNAIGGGDYNTIEPGVADAVIGGGHVNMVQSNSMFSTIGGGSGNDIQTNDDNSTISGGGGNLIQTGASVSTIAGGDGNMILGNDSFAVIGGGLENDIQNNAVECTIAGGRQNTIGTNAPDSVIGGGLINTIQTFSGGSVIAGGFGNLIQPGADVVNGEVATISGGLTNSVSGYGGTIGGGVQNTAGAFYATVGGGNINNAAGEYASIGGGDGNSAGGEYANIAGGGANTASSFADTVGGGYDNTASSPDGSTTVSGGDDNTASADSATVAGGYDNNATNQYGTVSGGIYNIAGGYGSVVPGGEENTASGVFSFAAGNGAQAVNNGSFVWADDSGGTFASTANNQFAVRANGGILFAGDLLLSGGSETYHNLSLGGGNSVGYLYASYPALGDGIHLGYNYYYDSNGAGHPINAGGATSRLSMQYGQIILAVGAVDGAPSTNRLVANMTGVTVYGTFNNSSDRNAKQDFAPINSAQILEKVGQLPICEWSYKEDPKTRHVGPMGQDFYATFNIGTDEKHIAPIDEGGVALAAIQGLNQKLEEKDAEIQEMKERLSKLERLIDQQTAERIR